MGVFKRPKNPKAGEKQYWYIRYQIDGRDYWESTKKTTSQITKSDALSILRKKRSEHKYGQVIDQSAKPGSITLNEFSREYINHKKNVENIVDWKRYYTSLKMIQEYFGDIDITEITPLMIDRFKKKRLVRVKPETVNHDLRCLRNAFNLAIRWGYFDKVNPVAVAELLRSEHKERRDISPEEEKLILSACPDYFGNIVIAGIDTGMRVSEIVNLTKDYVDMDNWHIIVAGTKSEKLRSRRYEQKPRIIPMTARLKAIIEKRMEKPYEYIFPNSRGRKWHSYNAIGAKFRKLMRSLGIKGLSFHCTRHTFATRLLDKGAYPGDVQTLLGHKDPKTTAIYNHPGKNLVKTIELLNENRSNTVAMGNERNLTVIDISYNPSEILE